MAWLLYNYGHLSLTKTNNIMKKLLLMPLLLMFLLIGCGKEDEKPSNKTTTEKTDPCENVKCVNGVCISGDCACRFGYEGVSCDIERTPKKMFIDTIIVTDFSMLDDNNDSWDVSSGNPDITFRVSKENTEIYEYDKYYENATSSKDYKFSLKGNPIEINEVTKSYAILLYDHDDSFGDDYMGGLSFTPFTKGGGFKQVIELKSDKTTVSFLVYISYEF